MHRSPKRPKTVLSGGRLREMTWWSQTNFFRDHLYHCYGFYLDRLDTPSSFSLISENQLIFRFWAIFDTKFSRYHRFEGTSSLSSVFVQLNSVSSVKKLWKNWVSYLSGGLMLPATNLEIFFWGSMAFAVDISMGFPMHIILTLSSMGFPMPSWHSWSTMYTAHFSSLALLKVSKWFHHCCSHPPPFPAAFCSVFHAPTI